MEEIYYIKKKIIAKNINEALRNKKTAEITDIWRGEEQKRELTPAIGFDIEKEDD